MKRTLCLILCIGISACGRSEVREAPVDDSAGGAAAPSAEPPVPDTLRDTVRLEGMPEPILLRRFVPPADFPLLFSTYVPADMEPEIDPATPGNPGAGLRFVANFGGTRTAEAFVHLFVYPSDATLEEVKGTARAFIESRGVPGGDGTGTVEIGPQTVRRFGWSVHEQGYRYQRAAAQWVVGTLALGQHGDRYFHIVTQFPEEFADGFGPRAAMIFDHWRWQDGSGLQGS